MRCMIIVFTLVCLTACATTSPKPHSEEKPNSGHTTHVKFVRYEGVKQKLYYPAGFYSENAEQAQDRTARAWWNQ